MHKSKLLPLMLDGSIDLNSWCDSLALKNQQVVLNAAQFAKFTAEDQLTQYNTNCFLQGLEIAGILNFLHLDEESIAVGILFPVFTETNLALEDIREQLGDNVAKLMGAVCQMNAIEFSSRHLKQQNTQQLDNIRKMLLAMVYDVRAVVVKLASRLAILRAIRYSDDTVQRKIFAKEIMEIYAPLANRLGLHEIKWQMEDLAFLELQPDDYKYIASNFNERRVDREYRVNKLVCMLNEMLNDAGISGKVYGRAKHIYSIKRKMDRKKVDFSKIFDAIAVRILVNNIKDCYTILSAAHARWEPVEQEFDDYIVNPKPNGYQSVHTAVIDEDGKYFEIQIRTFEMDEKAEKGVAAHWIYKEEKRASDYRKKITWLRQLLEWQKELSSEKIFPDKLEKCVFEDRTYVFTPTGDILDLQSNSTVLDFAYHIHTEVGHRCRGAKVNGHIVPLIYLLHTGDQVEVLTSKKSRPSRDWLIPQHGFLKTSSARAKVLQWFKRQDYSLHVSAGKESLEREFQRLNISPTSVELESAAANLSLKSVDHIYSSIGSGNLRVAQVISLLHQRIEVELPIHEKVQFNFQKKNYSKQEHKHDISVFGVDNLMTRIAKCCKPIPGDKIVGYITQFQGITIHRCDCNNIMYAKSVHPERLLEVCWMNKDSQKYPLSIEIQASDNNSPGLMRDITALLAVDKITIVGLNAIQPKSKRSSGVTLKLTVEIESLESLRKTLMRLSQLSGVQMVRRLR